MDHARKGATALDQKDSSLAVNEYTKALIEHPTSPDYYIQRSTAFTRLTPPRHDLALQDAEYAILFAQKRAKREKIQAAQQRRVVSLFGLGQYAEAHRVLEYMVRWRPKDNKKDKMEGDMWTAKVDSKLKTMPEDQRTSAISEYPQTELPLDDKISHALRKQLKADGTYNLNADSTDTVTADASANGTTADQAPTPAPLVSAPASTSQPATVRHEWYQNATSVILTLYAKGVAKDKVKHQFEADSFSISFPSPASPPSDYSFDLDPLCALIKPESSMIKIMSTKIEVTMAKATPGQKWPALEGNERPVQKRVSEPNDASTPAPLLASVTAPSYPTSSKSGAKNWDKLADELTAKKSKAKNKAEADGEKKPDEGDEDDGYESDYGGDAVDGFFKKLYAGADGDTRRAMMKSFQESNGTALSTNWSEVGKGRVEPVPDRKDDK